MCSVKACGILYTEKSIVNLCAVCICIYQLVNLRCFICSVGKNNLKQRKNGIEHIAESNSEAVEILYIP